MGNLLILTVILILINQFIAVKALPTGPVVSILGNSTKSAAAGGKVNSTNGSVSPGGFIFTMKLDSRQQNMRWKAYVGNVTGTLALDDSNDYTLYQWSLSVVEGEIYATRATGTINWTGINCTWIADAKVNPTQGLASNRTPEHNENEALSHTGTYDNITATFVNTNHSALDIGAVAIGKDECYSIQTWQKDAVQSFTDSDNANFTQVILYDGAYNTTSGNIVYATRMQDDIPGYDTTETFDFQMMLPENGQAGFSGSTAYYFYVELD